MTDLAKNTVSALMKGRWNCGAFPLWGPRLSFPGLAILQNSDIMETPIVEKGASL